MLDKYYEWMNIKDKTGSCLNKCAEWTEEMQQEFPELERVRGYVLLSGGLERPHWWLMHSSGQILDPTANQFCSSYYGGQWIIEYLPWDESRPEPKGKCMNCGEISFYESAACSALCLLELDDYYGQGWAVDSERRAQLLEEIKQCPTS